MPYGKKFIDNIIEINNNIKKSKITSMFFSLPYTCDLYTGFEQSRNLYINMERFDDWAPIISYAIEKGFEIVYLLNSSSAFSVINKNYDKELERLDKLVNRLGDLGCSTFRVSTPFMAYFMSRNYPKIKLYASTSFDYKSINEFVNFFKMYPKVSQIVPSHNINKNFKLLKNLLKLLPNVEFELMVNEGCLFGCPNRMWHSSNSISICEGDFDFKYPIMRAFYLTRCSSVSHSDYFLYLCMAKNIWPWEIEEYAKIGINNFKLVGRDSVLFTNGRYLDNYYLYLKGIEDYEFIENSPVNFFLNYIVAHVGYAKFIIKDVKKYLPKIDYFKKHGHLCASLCGVECTYCYRCAKKLEKHINSLGN